MARHDAASAGALALVALLTLWQSARLDVGSVSRPGPGLFPLVLAAALLTVSMALLAGAWRALRRQRSEDGPPATPGASARPGVLLATLLAFAVYVVVFERLGFLLATGGFLAFLLGPIARYRWPVALGAAVGATLATHVLFDVWLQVRLPRGVLAP
jgi:hypothetical protein